MCPSSAEPTKNHCISSNCTPRRSSPTRKARGSNPPSRTKSSTLWGAALFVLHEFYGAVKEGIRKQPVPRALRPAGQKRPGGAFLGRGLANPFRHTKKRIAMCFCNALFPDFRIILVAYHLPHQCIVLLPAVHFSVDLQ